MSMCDRCDRPAKESRTLVLFHDDERFDGWHLNLCKPCAGFLPKDLSLILGKEPD